MNLTERREQIAAALRAALGPQVPVYSLPPANVSPPCVIVATGAGTGQVRRRIWLVESTITVVGPAGDNEATVRTVEDLVLVCAAAVSELILGPVLWDRPAQTTYAGQQCYTVTLTVTSEVDMPAAAGRRRVA